MTDIAQDPQPQSPQGPDPRKLLDSVFGGSESSVDAGLLSSIMEDAGASKAQEARGLWENVGWQAAAAGKSAADSITHVATTFVKAASAVGSTFTDFDPRVGWNWVGEQLQQSLGTSDPGAMELWAPKTDIGKATDDVLNRRLGSARVAGDTIGSLLVFAKTPAIGEFGGQVAKPLADLSERGLARVLAGRAGVEVGEEALRNGTFWDVLAKTPEWQKSAGILDRVGMFTGRHTKDLISTTAANIAQSYAIAPENEKMRAIYGAAVMSPFMVPVARLGQWFSGASLSGMIREEGKSAVRSAMADFEAGKITMPELDRVVRANSSQGARLLSGGIGVLAEGTAFFGLAAASEPELWETFRRAQAGEPGAWGTILATWMGNVGGLAAAKMGMPGGYAPLFKALRPDLNTLDTYIEAEANRRALKEPPPKEEPQPVVTGEPADASVPDKRPDEAGMQALATAAEAGDQVAFKELQRWQATLERVQTETRERYGWAAPMTGAALKAGWEPSFPGKDSTDVDLVYGRDHLVRLQKTEDGQPQAMVSQSVLGELRKFGLKADYEAMSPTHSVAKGRDALELLDNLALLGVYRRLQGDLLYQRMGFREVEPGIWADGDGRYHTMQLDGSSATREAFDKGWTGRADMQAAGGFEEPKWNNQTSLAMADWLTQKHTIAPDDLVDGILGQALTLAQSGHGFGADQLRQFLGATPMEALQPMLRKGEDRMLALRLGALAAGNDNAAEVGNALRPSKSGLPGPETEVAAEVAAAPIAKPEMTMTERLAARPPETGMAGSAGAGIKEELGRRLGKPLKSLADWTTKTQTEVIENALPGNELSRGARASMAERGSLVGESRRLFKPAEKALRKSREGKAILKAQEPAQGFSEGSTVPGWLGLGDATREASTPVQRAVQGGLQAPSKFLWSKAAEVGFTRNEKTPEGMRTVPLTERDRATTQRIPGKDSDKVYDDPVLRGAWFEALSAANPQTKFRGETMTPAQREAEWVEMKATQGKVSSAESEAAVEITRRDRNVAYTWKAPDGKTYEMFETSPFRVMERLTERQSSRIAHVRQFGQDFSKDQRVAILNDPNMPAAVKANAQRGGTEAALAKLEQGLRKSLASEQTIADTKAYASDLLKRTQGVEPVEMQKFAKVLQPFTAVISASRAAAAFVYDVFEPLVRNPSYAGLSASLRAIAKGVTSPRELIARYEDLGVIDRQIGDHVVSEAKGIGQRLANAVGWLASATERWKGAVAGHVADAVIARAKAGRLTLNDIQVASDILRLPQEEMLKIRNGQVSDEIANQWRRELTQLITSRGRPAEGTSFAASPNVKSYVQFVNFATRRGNAILRTVASLKIAADRSGWMSRDTYTAAKRLMSMTSGMAAGGLLGVALGQTIVGMFAGHPIDEGLKKWFDAANADKTSALLKALQQQAIGGPAQQLINAAAHPESAQDVANLTVPSATFWTLAKAVKAAIAGDGVGVQAMTKLAGDLGLIPFKTHLGNLYAAAFAANPQARLDAKFVHGWMREQGIQPTFGERNKPDAFYDAISAIEDAANSSGGDRKVAMEKAMDGIRTALALAPEESVAGAIEGHQLLHDLSDAQRTDLFSRMDERRANRLGQHDELLRNLAHEVRKMEGTNPTEWEAELDAVTKNAALGASDRWGRLMDRALDETAQRIADREPMGRQIDDVAERMAMFPEQMTEGMFSERLLRAVQDPRIDSATRARRIAGIMKSRIKGRVDKMQKDRAEAARAR